MFGESLETNHIFEMDLEIYDYRVKINELNV